MNRLSLLACLSKGSEILCDVGCDHAYVLVDAIKYHGVKRGIAADIGEGPLKIAKETIFNNNLSNKIDVVLSDGFKNINLPFDTAIIAGMGGALISNIIIDGLSKIKDKKLILEPNNDAYRVRKTLSNNGFIIIDEFAINDMNKYYEIIVAIKGNASYNEFELKYGPILLNKRERAFIDHYKRLYDHINSIIDSINNLDVKKEKMELLDEYSKIINE